MTKPFLGYQPRAGQAILHRAVADSRFLVVTAHRRWGKSTFVRMELLRRALFQPHVRVAYIAPYRAHARRLSWGPLVEQASTVPDTSLCNVRMQVSCRNGSIIQCFGADDATALHGHNFDLIACDEFPPDEGYVQHSVIPALAPGGKLLMIGTGPAVATGLPPWTPHLTASAFDSGVFSDGELLLLRDTLTPRQFRREFLCDYREGLE
jgi:hypothetical protein